MLVRSATSTDSSLGADQDFRGAAAGRVGVVSGGRVIATLSRLRIQINHMTLVPYEQVRPEKTFIEVSRPQHQDRPLAFGVGGYRL